MDPKKGRARQLWIAGVTACCIGLLLAGAAYLYGMPRFANVQFQYEGKEKKAGTIPLYAVTDAQGLEVWFTLQMRAPSPTRFTITPDDCIDQLKINGQDIHDADGLCGHGAQGRVDLSRVLHSGDNDVYLKIRDNGGLGGLFWQTSLLTLHGAFLVLFLILVTALAVLLCRGRKDWRPWIPFVLAIALGITLRVLYVHATPFTLRGHDTDAHIDYISYVAEHWAIPQAGAGWEFHQPPLYYALSALWLRVGFAAKMNGLFLQQLQWASLACSIGAFLAAAWAGWILLRKQGAWAVALFTAVAGVFPSILFVAGRVSNDTLSHFLTFLCFALLIRWWQTGNLETWIGLAVCLSLSFLTKVSVLLLIPVCLVCLVIRNPWKQWKKTLAHGVLFLAVFGCLAGWLPAYRLFLEADHTKTLTLGNQGMQDGLKVTTTLPHLLVFNPIGMLQHPFNNPWSDDERRQFFWEYVARSSLFGEFGFDPVRALGKYMLLCLFLLLPLLPLGLWQSLRERIWDAIPVVLALGALLGGALLYRLQFPYGPNQDFRFTILAVLPLAYLITLGVRLFPKDARFVAWGVCVSFIAVCTIFFVQLSLLTF